MGSSIQSLLLGHWRDCIGLGPCVHSGIFPFEGSREASRRWLLIRYRVYLVARVRERGRKIVYSLAVQVKEQRPAQTQCSKKEKDAPTAFFLWEARLDVLPDGVGINFWPMAFQYASGLFLECINMHGQRSKILLLK